MPNTAAELHVAVGVIYDQQGRLLLAQRHSDSHQGGLWEFPGGKVEPGESLAQALCRELLEELGITVREHRPLLTITHDYGDRRVVLDVHEVLQFTGEARSLEGQPLRWVRREELGNFTFPAANRGIVERLITD